MHRTIGYPLNTNLRRGLQVERRGDNSSFSSEASLLSLGQPSFHSFYIQYTEDSRVRSSELKSNSVIHNLQPAILYLTVLASFPFFFFAFASLRSKYTDVGWSDVALIVGIILMSKVLIDTYKEMGIRKKIIIYSALFIPGFLLSAFLAVHSIKPFPFIPKNVDKSLEMFGWDEIGAKAEEVFNKYLPDEKRRY